MVVAALARFRDDDRGLTLVESSFLMLFLLLVMVNGTELDRYARFARHLGLAAEGVGVLMGQRHQPMRNADWSEDASLLFWLVPEVPALSGAQWRSNLGVQATFVRFEPSDPACETDCTYSAARVLWTWGGGTAGSRNLLAAQGFLRGCDLLVRGPEKPAAQSLPASLFQKGYLLIVTLVHDYKPFFSTSVVGERTILREAYVVPAAGELLIDPLGIANEVVPCP